jgi:hypothetical protein
LNVRDLLLAAGVSERDIAEAVRESRHATRQVGAGARLLARMLTHVGERSKLGSKRQIVAFVGSEWLQKIGKGADRMLEPSRPMQHASKRVPVRRKT